MKKIVNVDKLVLKRIVKFTLLVLFTMCVFNNQVVAQTKIYSTQRISGEVLNGYCIKKNLQFRNGCSEDFNFPSSAKHIYLQSQKK